MVNLIKWLTELEHEDLPKDDGWAALDAIKLLNPRKKHVLISELRASLAEKVFKNKDYTQPLQDRLTDDDQRAILERYEAGVLRQQLASEYGISVRSVGRVLRVERLRRNATRQ